MSNFKIIDGTNNEIKIALGQMKKILPEIIELQTITAQIVRARFNALVKEGFSEEQAVELCKNVSSTNAT